jgi:hypothetical protein
VVLKKILIAVFVIGALLGLAYSLRPSPAPAETVKAKGEVDVPPGVAHPDWLKGLQDAQLASAASIGVPHDFKFTDRIDSSGITFRLGHSADLGKFYRAVHYDHGTAVATADVDMDGKPDLFFANQAGKNALYRNLGGGKFQDMTDSAGVAVGDRACVGAAFADVDDDGDPDLFITSVRDGNLLFLNDGHGHFTNVTDQAGIKGNGGHSSGPVFFDYDGDGLLDLFVPNVGKYTQDQKRPDGLWESFLDAFAGHLHPERSETSILYHNLGNARFEDVTSKSGLVHAAWSGEATALDYDGDGRLDLYVLSMQGHDELWHNAGNGRFERKSREGFPATPWGSMGVKVFDWNGDGRLDLFVTDMHTDMSTELLPQDDNKKHDPATMFPPRFLATDGNHVLGNALFSNTGGGHFKEMSDAAKLETGWPWGPSVADFNADGWPDVFISAGMNYPFRYRGNDLLLNVKGDHFAHAEFVVGIEPRPTLTVPWFDLDCDGEDVKNDICQGEVAPVLNTDPADPKARGKGEPRHGVQTVWASRGSRSSIAVDLDGDGDLDIVTNNYGDLPQVFISDLAQHGPVHFVNVQFEGHRDNRNGIGAVVVLTSGGRAQTQVNDGKLGYLGQSVLPLYFGLGSAADADSVTVKWSSGDSQVVKGPFKSGQTIVVQQQAARK